MRRVRLSLLSLLALCFAAAAPASADEGMWLPEQLPGLSGPLTQLGLRLDPARLADLTQAPLNAIISLGGCSASFVSAQGLVVTNHHCAVDALQTNSTADRNYLEDGFYADTMADEAWAGPTARVYVTTEISDVTAEIVGAIPADATDVQRFDAIDAATKRQVAACEETPGYRCEVAEFFAGASFGLIKKLEIEDVRVVYAPPEMVGFFGGDVDNWMWPRHTGDWAFFRAYVGPDGLPAPFSEENVPYRPVSHLEVRAHDLDEGDFVMVAGYPGVTYRYRTGSEMAWARDASYPWNIATMTDLLSILGAVAAADADAAVRLSSLQFGLSNYQKNNEGMLDNFRTGGAVERTVARDAALRATLAARADAEALGWVAALDELEALLVEARRTADRDRLIGWLGWSVDALNVAHTALWLADERPRADMERDAGYQERDWPRIRDRVEALETSFVAEADARLLAYFMRRIAALDLPELRPAIVLFSSFAPEGAADPFEAAADAILERTLLVDGAERLALLEAERVDLDEAQDPIVQLARALYPVRRAQQILAEEHEGALSRLRPRALEALRSVASAPVYPDANGTLRVTFGMVRGYAGPDGVWFTPFTTVLGVVAKHTGTEPFDAPADLRAAIEAEVWGRFVDPDLGTVPVDFLSTTDTTGGNSGSATLDEQGRLCGLLFDGNYESMASDWLFDPVATRSIHVSAQYMLWSMRYVDGATRVLSELGFEAD